MSSNNSKIYGVLRGKIKFIRGESIDQKDPSPEKFKEACDCVWLFVAQQSNR